MISAFLVYALVLLFAFALFRNGRWLELSIAGIPIVFCGYFLISIGIFSFGEIMPFTYYNSNRTDEYGYVSVMICLHFLVVLLGFLIVGRYDQRQYKPYQLRQIKSIGLGALGALFCLLPLVFVVISLPTSVLWERNTFATDVAPGSALRFADLLAPVSALLIPFIRSSLMKYTILALVTLGFLALGSRTAILMLFVFSAMNLAVIQRARTSTSLACLALGFWLLGTILLLRNYNAGGLLVVLRTAIFGDYGAIGDAIIYGSNYNFNLSFVLIAELIASVQTEDRWFYYGVLPLPSAFFDQTSQYDAINRFRKNIPFPGLGYIWAHIGPFVYFSFVFLSTLAFLFARKVVSVNRDIYEAILCFSIFAFPLIILLQYNLRTGTRIAYVLILIYFFVAFWRNGAVASRNRRAVRVRR